MVKKSCTFFAENMIIKSILLSCHSKILKLNLGDVSIGVVNVFAKGTGWLLYTGGQTPMILAERAQARMG